jgi:hypothetical protein
MKTFGDRIIWVSALASMVAILAFCLFYNPS